MVRRTLDACCGAMRWAAAVLIRRCAAAREVRRVLTALVCSTVVVLAVGCGGGDSGSNPVPTANGPTGGTGTTTPPPSGGTTTPPPSGGATTPPPSDGTTTPPPSGGSTTPPTSGGTSTTPGAIVPTWYGVQANILQKYCTSCHSGAFAPMGLSWEVDKYDAVVTGARMSGEITTLKEVDPGNPDASYVMWKLRGQGPTGQAIQGVRMPAFAAALDAALIDVMAQWIRAGAPLGTPSDATGGTTTTPPSSDGGTTTPPPSGGTTTPPPSDGGSTTPPPSGGTGTTTPATIVPTWYGVQANILQKYCTSCHSGAFAPMGLSWEVDKYDAVVTGARMSGEITTLKEVDPSNPDASYLIWKLRGQGPTGQAIQGARMPAFGPALDPALIDVMVQWIRDGAPLGTPADATASGTTTPPPSGDGTTTPPPSGGTTTPPSSTPGPTGIVPSWYGVQGNILQRYCTACHSNPLTLAPMALSWEVDRYDAIVTERQVSVEIPGFLPIVDPGKPDNSYMMWKLRGHGPSGQPIVGVRMPATGIALDPAFIDVIDQWIRLGAPRGVPADAALGSASIPSYPVGSWMYVWTESLQVCTMCHSPTPSSLRCGSNFWCPPNGVMLTADNYTGVVNGDTVKPSDPANSKLWQRVTNSDPAARMPYGLNPLSQRQLDIIFNWISAGAPLCPTNQVCP